MNHLCRRYLLSGLAGFLSLLTASAAVAMEPPPAFTKVFTPDTIGSGSTTALIFTIDNGDSAVPADNLSFTDNLPGDLTLASSVVINGCGGDVIAQQGGTSISLTGGRVGLGGSCQIEVYVISATPQTHTNTSGDLTSSLGNSGTATDDLAVVLNLPGFSKSFAPSSISSGDRATLTFLIDNTPNQSRVGNLNFTDNLPAGVVVADPSNASTDCVSANAPDTTLAAVAGSSQIVLDANGSTFAANFEVLPANGSCTVKVDVTAPAPGDLQNVTTDLLADFDAVGRAANSLAVQGSQLDINKRFLNDPVIPGSTVDLEFTITNFDRNNVATDVTFTDDLSAVLAGLMFAGSESSDCGGTFSGSGTTMVGFSGGMIAPSATCTITVSLSVPSGAAVGSYDNTTSAVMATLDGSSVVGDMASDTLFVASVPNFSKAFLDATNGDSDPVVKPGDDIVLQFTIENTSATSAATDITFEDELTTFLPSPLNVILPPDPNPPCGAGSSLAFYSPGTDRQGLSLSGGNLAASESCSFSVTISLPNDLPGGSYVNITEPISATVDGATLVGGRAMDDFEVIAAPSLQKAFTDDPVAPGDTVTLEFTLTHSEHADAAATGISFTDDLDATLSGLEATTTPIVDPCGSGSSLAGTDVLTLTGGSLASGDSCSFSVTLNVPDGAAPGSYQNITSDVTADVGGIATQSQPAVDDLVVTPLRFSKEFLSDPVLPGEVLTLRFTIENVSSADVTNMFFTDSLQAVLPGLMATGAATSDSCGGSLSGTAVLMYNGGSVMSGQSCTIEVTVLVPAGAADGIYTNITSVLFSNLGTADSAVDTLQVQGQILELEKTISPEPVITGNQATISFELTNISSDDSVADIAFSDDLDAALSGATLASIESDDCGGAPSGLGTGTFSYSAGALAATESCEIVVTFNVPASAAPNTYTNTTSSVSGMVGNLEVGGPAAEALFTVSDISVTLAKSFLSGAFAGEAVTMRFELTNNSMTASVDELRFSDDLDVALTGLVAVGLPQVDVCGSGSQISGTSLLTITDASLAANSSCTIDVVLAVPSNATLGMYTNTTSPLVRGAGSDEVDDAATAVLTIADPIPILAVTKTALPTFVDEPGGTVSYSVVISNAGPQPVTLTAVNDNMVADTGCSVGTRLLSGSALPCTYSANVSGNAGDTVMNTFTATVQDGGGEVAMGTAAATVVVNDALPDFTVTKSANPTSVTEPGGTVSYAIAVTNSGAETITITAISDSQVPNTGCQLNQAVTAGSTYSCVYQALVSGSAGDVVTNNVTVTVTDDDGNTGQDSASANVTIVNTGLAVVVSKSASPGSVSEAGGNVDYRITVSNTGAAVLTLVDVDDSQVSNTGCNIGATVAPGDALQCSYRNNVSGNAGTVVRNQVVVTLEDSNGNEVSGSANADVTITDLEPDFVITKTASPVSVPADGATVSYTVTISNRGSESLQLTDIGDSMTGSTGCPINSTISARNSISCTYNLFVQGSIGGAVVNTVTVIVSDDDGNREQANAQAVVNVTDATGSTPLIGVSKTATPDRLSAPGGAVTYAISVTNRGAGSVTITDIQDDQVPNHGCAADAVLVSGAVFECVYVVNVNGAAGDEMVNIVRVSVSGSSGENVTNSASATVAIVDAPVDLAITANNVPALPVGEGLVTLSLRAENLAALNASNVAIDARLFGEADLNLSDRCQDRTVPGSVEARFSCTPENGDLLATQSREFSVDVGAGASRDLFLIANVDQAETDTNLDNDSTSLTVQIAETVSDVFAFLLGENAGSTASAFGDVNGDGNADNLLAGPDGALILINDGFGGLKLQSTLHNDSVVSSVLVDVDGDDDRDIVEVIADSNPADGTNATLRVLPNDGQGSFASPNVVTTVGNSRQITFGDLNGDGSVDIVSANTSPNQVLLNDGAGGFSRVASLGDSQSRDVVLVDLDGDGDLDAVFANDDGGALWTNDGVGNFAGPTRIGNGQFEAVAHADFDGDGNQDLVFARRLDDPASEPPSNPVFLNNGTGVFAPASEALGFSDTLDVAAADIDGDGSTDIFAVNASGGHRVYLNDGAAGFVAASNLLISADAQTALLADVDNDGDIDLLLNHRSGIGAKLFANDAEGNLGVQRQQLRSSGGGAVSMFGLLVIMLLAVLVWQGRRRIR